MVLVLGMVLPPAVYHSRVVDYWFTDVSIAPTAALRVCQHLASLYPGVGMSNGAA